MKIMKKLYQKPITEHIDFMGATRLCNSSFPSGNHPGQIGGTTAPQRKVY